MPVKPTIPVAPTVSTKCKDFFIQPDEDDDVDIPGLMDDDSSVDFSGNTGLPAIDLAALEQKIQAIESTTSNPKSSSDSSTRDSAVTTAQNTEATSSNSRSIGATVASIPDMKQLVQQVKQHNDAWKKWLKSSGHRKSSGADPSKYDATVLQQFLKQL